jgi:prepilin-type N-terminal cleavage/methylation domain-containing protein
MRLTNPHNPIRRRAGFTLLEVILAVLITGIVSAGLFASMSGTFKMRRQVEDHLSGRETARAAITLIRGDLQGVPPAGGRISGVFAGEDETGRGNADTDVLSYVTSNRVLPSDQDFADLRLVELRLLESAEDPDYYVLARLVTGNLLASITPEPSLQIIARRVVSLEMRYFADGIWLNTYASDENDNEIPAAVELTLVIAPELSRPPEEQDELEKTYITLRQIIRLPASEIEVGDINLGF